VQNYNWLCSPAGRGLQMINICIDYITGRGLQVINICIDYITGRGLQRLHGHGPVLSVLQLDHQEAQQPHPGPTGLQVRQHPGHLRLRELRGGLPGGSLTPVQVNWNNLLKYRGGVSRWTASSSSTSTTPTRSCRSTSTSTSSPWSSWSTTSRWRGSLRILPEGGAPPLGSCVILPTLSRISASICRITSNKSQWSRFSSFSLVFGEKGPSIKLLQGRTPVPWGPRPHVFWSPPPLPHIFDYSKNPRETGTLLPHVLVLSCREGLVWADINWMDNGECLDLIEKVRGGGGDDDDDDGDDDDGLHRNWVSWHWWMRRVTSLKPQTAPCWRSCTASTR